MTDASTLVPSAWLMRLALAAFLVATWMSAELVLDYDEQSLYRVCARAEPISLYRSPANEAPANEVGRLSPGRCADVRSVSRASRVIFSMVDVKVTFGGRDAFVTLGPGLSEKRGAGTFLLREWLDLTIATIAWIVGIAVWRAYRSRSGVTGSSAASAS